MAEVDATSHASWSIAGLSKAHCTELLHDCESGIVRSGYECQTKRHTVLSQGTGCSPKSKEPLELLLLENTTVHVLCHLATCFNSQTFGTVTATVACVCFRQKCSTQSSKVPRYLQQACRQDLNVSFQKQASACPRYQMKTLRATMREHVC